ncbi:MAG: type IV toxin-antitoxin system AbiEi family antitoxin domain-containing protein [Kangiellaceae bacterium]|nr:type IV toxin-antitoxin system AbiEi family antitoxin domain-containing protein [Kangiellaceae bacterium]
MFTICIVINVSDKAIEPIRNQIFKQIEQILKNKSVVTVKDLVSANISRNTLADMANEGLLTRIKPGVYESNNRDVSEFESFVDISAQAPNGVIALLSALQFHGITTENPHRIWVAFLRGQRIPSIEYPPMRHVIFSEKAYRYGIEEHIAQGVTFKVYSVAKTIADCFKYRHKIGLDVAIEALKESVINKIDINEIWEAAKVCRVQKIIRPYMEAI